MTFRTLCLLVLRAPAAVLLFWANAPRLHAQETASVTVSRVPDGGLQTQVIVKGNAVHLLGFKGDPKAGDLFL